MQAYIDQLLGDIAKAQRPEQEEPQEEKLFSIEQHFEEVERWLAADGPGHTFSYYCGLKAEQFPPEERLTDEQLLIVWEAYQHLLFSFNLSADIPKSVPLRKAYPLLISTLNKEVEMVTAGFITIEFCNYDSPSCPFGEYCACKEYLEKYDEKNIDSSNVDSELPF